MLCYSQQNRRQGKTINQKMILRYLLICELDCYIPSGLPSLKGYQVFQVRSIKSVNQFEEKILVSPTFL